MFSDTTEVVTLGVPCKKHSTDSSLDATKSKLGGRPLWLSVSPLPSAESPVCECSKVMVFVCQVYAPTQVDRCLYFYCCPSGCAQKSGGWRVYRDQTHEDQGQNQVPTEPLSSSNAPPAPPSTDWSAVCSNESLQSGDDDLSDLLALLDTRDATTPATAPTAPLPPPSTTVPDSGGTPVVVLDEYEEPSATGADTSHEEELLRRYLSESQGEEDEDRDRVLAMLDTCRDIGGDSSDEEDDGEDVRELQGVISRVRTARTGIIRDGKKKTQVEESFRRRVTREPRQVLRYAYGGSPLWCTHPVPEDSSSVAVCSGCGSERVFEMQLMPGLISHLTKSIIVTSPEEGIDIDSIDFGVVAVWSCPISCSRSVAEIVVVQPPGDT